MSYRPGTSHYLSWAAARRGFAAGTDTPRAFLERCLETIAVREPSVQAFTALDLAGARAAADAATERWRANGPLSRLDGAPMGVKDCFDVRGMPTEVNSPLFEGQVADIDCAHVDALRQGGAYPLGKTVTTELTMAGPGPTWNPWDVTRTPGGSSSGSAAAVAAGMVPLATGSQVRGSVIRPASLCGIVGFKPTFGALNRHGGFDPSPSLNHLGLLGGHLEDVWDMAWHIGRVAGGDPGERAFDGPMDLPPPRRPLRLARQYTPGWPLTDGRSKALFESWLRDLQLAGVEILEPDADADLLTYEAATTATPDFFFPVMLWEMRWPMNAWAARRPEALSATVHGYLQKANAMTAADYEKARLKREELRSRHRGLAGRVDGFITLAHIGPAQSGQPAVGTPWYNDASSAIGAPTFSVPVMAIDGLPLGVQIMGFEHEEADLAAQARWLLERAG